MPYNSHIRSPNSLITPSEETQKGFISIALEKNKKAIPFVEEARKLKAIVSARAGSAKDLLNINEIRDSLITAAGISDKAKEHFNEEDEKEAIAYFIERFLEPSESFVDELVYRFLLIKGDALGGSIRNHIGKVGERRFTRSLISTLSMTGRSFKCCFDLRSGTWREPDGESDLEKQIRGLHWTYYKKERVLIYNLTVPFVRKNVDICLLDCSPKEIVFKKGVDSAHKTPQKYLALGELKSGIDPAGADERWKTAKGAFYTTIKDAFSKEETSQPYTFFVGAAIGRVMAEDIYERLENGTLTNSANLTNKSQVEELCNWLTSI